MKKPKLEGQNYGYLGHFAQEKYLCQGHNDSGKIELRELQRAEGIDPVEPVREPDPVLPMPPIESEVSAKKKAEALAKFKAKFPARFERLMQKPAPKVSGVKKGRKK